MGWMDQIKEIIKESDAFYRRRAMRTFRQDRNEIDNFFMLLTFSELYGIENPFAYYTLDMLPVLAPKFHEWHQRHGFQESFYDNFPCFACCH